MSHIVAERPTAAKATYDDLGVVQVSGLLTADEVAEIRAVFMDQVEHDRSVGCDDGVPDGDPLSLYPRFVQPHRTDTAMGRLARRWMLDPRIMGQIAELVGPPLAAQSMFYFKPPTARGQALHQDNLFLQTHPETCIAAWIAIDDCDAENGGLRVVPTSHRFDIACPEEADMNESFTSGEVRVPEDMERVQTEMKAGDVLFFHGSLVHGSLPNTSDHFRRSLIFHYVPQGSYDIARMYQPLLTPAGDEVTIDESPDGGPCGEGWQPSSAH